MGLSRHGFQTCFQALSCTCHDFSFGAAPAVFFRELSIALSSYPNTNKGILSFFLRGRAFRCIYFGFPRPAFFNMLFSIRSVFHFNPPAKKPKKDAATIAQPGIRILTEAIALIQTQDGFQNRPIPVEDRVVFPVVNPFASMSNRMDKQILVTHQSTFKFFNRNPG